MIMNKETSVESVELEKSLELRLSCCWKSSPMQYRVNWGNCQKLLRSSYLCEESSHTKS